MANYTQNLGLELPTINEFYNVTDVVNKNNQKIDAVAHNENLLDNGWFTINQRGQSRYDGFQYSVDRWLVSYGNSSGYVNVTEDGLHIVPLTDDAEWIVQRIENLDAIIGKMVTVSILYKDGTIDKNSFEMYRAINMIYNDRLHGVVSVEGDLQFRFRQTVDVRAIKLELGSVSTLANDSAPNYASELLKCQRYFQNIIAPLNANIEVSSGLVTATTVASFPLKAIVPMRTAPIVSGGGDWSLWSPQVGYKRSNSASGHARSNDFIWIDLIFTVDLTSIYNNTAFFVLRNGATLTLSADL